MAEYNSGRFGIQQPYDPSQTQDPFRGVFTEGLRKTGVDIGEGVASYLQGDPGSQQTEWNAPSVESGGALDSGFSGYKMTPGSPGLEDSGHWNVIQPGALGSDNKTVAPEVDPVENPGSAVAVATARQNGTVSQDRPTQNQQPTANQVATKQFEQQGKQQVAQKWMQQPWNQNKGMNMALISFGLNLLSGNDWAQSFNSAGNVYQDINGQEERKSWAEEMLGRGYSPAEVQQWVASGDSKVLTDPSVAKAREQQLRLGDAQIKKAEYETSDEYLTEQKAKEARKEAREDLRLSSDISHRAATLNVDRERLNLDRQAKIAAAQDKKDAAEAKFQEGKHKSTMYNLRANQGHKAYQSLIEKNPGVYYNDTVMADLGDAVTIEAMFSGNQLYESGARKANPRMAEMISAERAFLAPVLRIESGAAISNMEWKTTGEQFFPRPGDSEYRIDQKRQLRDIAVLATKTDASPELKAVMDAYSHSALEGLKVIKGQAYASEDGKTWVKIPMSR
ncbi:MAG: hypothetical protein ACRC6V_00585 [Bacteroidales bacterium]